MLTKWRSLIVTGVMLSALVFGSTTAWAQAPVVPANPPSGVSLTPVDYQTIQVNWTATADPAEPASGTVNRDGFDVAYVQRATGDDFDAMTPTTMTVSTVSRQATITGLAPEKRYVVAVRASAGAKASDVTTAGDGPWVFASPAGVSTLAAPMPEEIRKRDMDITAGDMELTVEWDEPGAGGTGLTISSYQVQFATKRDGSDKKDWPYDVTSRILTIDRLANDTMYYVAVGSTNSAGGVRAPNFAEAVSATPMAPELGTPMNVMATGGDAMISVSWDAVDRADSYEVSWWPTGGGVISNVEVTGMSYDIMNLMNGTEYEVTVASMMGEAKSEASDIVRATPMSTEPVPALPLFGMLALGAGLVAAGRRRLHAQRLLKN